MTDTRSSKQKNFKKKDIFNAEAPTMPSSLPSSPFRLFLLTLAAIFISEFLIMLFIAGGFSSEIVSTAAIDSLILLFFLFPILMVFVYRPIKHHFHLRKHYENRLLIEKSFSESVINNLPGIFFLIDNRGRLCRWNANLAQLSGLDERQLAAMDPRDFFPSKHKDAIQLALEEAENSGNTELETSLLTSGKKPIPFLFKASRIEINHDIYIIGYGIDITVQKEAEKSTRENEAIFRSVAESATDGIISININSEIIYFNSAAAAMFGYTPAEMEQINLHDLMPEHLRPLHDEAIDRYKNNLDFRPSKKSYDTTGLKKDGSTFPIEVSFASWKRTGDLYFTSILRDATDHQIAQKKLQRAYDEWESTFNSIPDLITIISTNQEIRLVNEGMAQAFKTSREELVGMKCFEIFQCAHASEGQCPHMEALKQRKEVTREVYIDKINRQYMISSTPVFDNNGNMTGIVEVGRDITDRKRMESAMVKMRNLESLGVLAGGIAHDFNNLLTAILGNVQLVKMLAKDNEKVQPLLENAETASRKAHTLATQLLTFSKGGSPVKTEIDIVRLIKKVIENCSLRFPHEFLFDAPPSSWRISADTHQLLQVFDSLLENAAEAMNSGGTIQISLENIGLDSPLTIEFDDDEVHLLQGKYVVVQIKDSGVGISKEHRSKIFDPYFTTKERNADKGQGLSLSICYSIIKSHMGYIFAKDNDGPGITMTVYLPSIDG